jgi:hypothetical protein
MATEERKESAAVAESPVANKVRKRGGRRVLKNGRGRRRRGEGQRQREYDHLRIMVPTIAEKEEASEVGKNA